VVAVGNFQNLPKKSPLLSLAGYGRYGRDCQGVDPREMEIRSQGIGKIYLGIGKELVITCRNSEQARTVSLPLP